MNCKSTVESLSAYLDRELGPSERDAVRMHLAGCDRCRAEEQELRSLKGLLLGVRAPEPAKDFEQRLMSGLRDEAVRPLPRRFEAPRLRPVAFGQWGGLAVAATLAAIVLTYGPRNDSTPPTILRGPTTVVQNLDRTDVYAQHDEAYERADDPTSGAPLLMSTTDAP